MPESLNEIVRFMEDTQDKRNVMTSGLSITHLRQEVEVLFPINTYNTRACVLSTKTEMRNETKGNVTLLSKSAYSSTI